MSRDHRRPPRIGSLRTGRGRRDLAVLAVLGGHLLWFADNNPAAANPAAHASGPRRAT